MLARGSKVLLKNVIKQTDTHNRIVEEEDMWRQRGQEATRTTSPSFSRRSTKNQHRAHMDSPDDCVSRSYAGREESTSNFWMQKLYDANAADPDRWGHAGYRELYPEEFDTPRTRTSSESSSEDDRKRSKKAKKKKTKRSKSHKKKKNKKRKHERGTSSETEEPATAARDKSRSPSRRRRFSERESRKKRKTRSPEKSSRSSSGEESRSRSPSYRRSKKRKKRH